MEDLTPGAKQGGATGQEGGAAPELSCRRFEGYEIPESEQL